MSACRKLVEQALYLLLDRALPDGRDRPASGLKGSAAGAITGEIPIELGIPEFDVGGRPPAARAVVSMPEATVDKDDDAVARKDDVGRSRQVPAMQSVSVASGKERRSDGALGAGVLSADRGHHPRSDGCGNRVSQTKCPVWRASPSR